MPIFVEHKETHDLFVLISGGYGAFQSAVLREIGGVEKSSETELMVCVCDRNGELGWLFSNSVRVIHVDGTNIEDLFDLGAFKAL